MSIKVMSKVFEWSQAEGTDRLVMLALADFCDDDAVCYPGISRIAKKCRISERTVQRSLMSLRSLGELWQEMGAGVEVKGKGFTSKYELRLKPGCQDVTPKQDRGDTGGKTGVTVLSPKPSVEPSEGIGLEDKGGPRKRPSHDLFSDLLPQEWIPDFEFADSWKGFVDMRRAKHPLTDKAVKLLAGKMRKWGKLKSRIALDNATIGHWRDLYEPKLEELPAPKPQPSDSSSRYPDFIQSYPSEKTRNDFPEWSQSLPPWLKTEFNRWMQSGKYTTQN